MWYKYKHNCKNPAEYYEYIHTDNVGITFDGKIYVNKSCPCNDVPKVYFKGDLINEFALTDQEEAEAIFKRLKLEQL